MNRRFAAVLAASLLLLLPVLLQEHVQAGDLASHLYNTWLVLLVKQGEPLGLEIVPQFSNVLFDWWLEGLWQLGGPKLAEKGATGAAVLCFFWGAFVLLGRLSGRPAWPSAPLLAMLAYGWIYHQGFFNYYLSCAFGFWALASVLGRSRQRWLALPTLLLAALAHLLGAAVAAAFAGWLLLRERTGESHRFRLLAAAVLALAVAGLSLWIWLPSQWKVHRLIHLAGFTPFHVFEGKYLLIGVLLFLLWVLRAAWIAEQHGWKALQGVAADCVMLTAAAIVVLPTGVLWSGTNHPLYFIDWRLALWYVLFVGSWVASFSPARPVAGWYATLAVAFFLCAGADWRTLGQVEKACHEAVSQLPPRARVVAGFTGLPLGLNPLLHMIDRACIGRCFSYANYEPASAQFRLRSRPQSPVVMSVYADISSWGKGEYVVKESDEPLYCLALQSRDPFALRILRLRAGDPAPLEHVRLPPAWF